MKNSTLLSICCISYNHEKYIAQAIEGFLSQQTSFEIEILIHDDASTDGTQAIIKKYQQKDSRIKAIFRETNLKSTGIPIFPILYKEAKGKYIALCEGDDYWTDPLKLQKQVEFLEANPGFSLCFHETDLISDQGFIRKYSNVNKTEFKTEDLFGRHFIATSSIVFRNTIEIPEWFFKVASGDIALMLLLSLQGKFWFLNETMSVYRRHQTGVSKTHYGVKKVYDMAILYNYFNEFSQLQYTQLCYSALLYEIETQIVKQKIEFEQLERLPFHFLVIYLIRRLIRKLEKNLKPYFEEKKN